MKYISLNQTLFPALKAKMRTVTRPPSTNYVIRKACKATIWPPFLLCVIHKSKSGKEIKPFTYLIKHVPCLEILKYQVKYDMQS